MKKQFYSKLLFLFALLLTVSTSAWAEEVTLTAGTNGSACTVNEKAGIKVGTSSKGGSMSITVPANTISLSFHAAAWNNVSGLSLNITGATATPASVSLTSNTGIANSSPFTLNGNEEDYFFTITLSGVTTETTLTFTSSIAKRFVVWDASAVVSSGGGDTPTLEESDLALTGAPIALNFDLYNNSADQVIHYTTSSTGAVTVSGSDYVTTVVDQENKTITVTPDKKTPLAQTITVSQAADGTYNAGETTFTVSITDSTPKTGKWELTDLTDLTADDVFVIVGNNGSNYAMSNNNGTSSAPSAVAVTINNDEITSDVDDNIKWNISGNATEGYTFYPNGTTSTWLYCTNANNGVRVGEGEAKNFAIHSSGYLYTSQTTDTRYLGIYNSQDWRCYTNTTGNTKDQTFAFFKYVSLSPLASIAVDVTNAPTQFHQGDDFSHDGAVVTATYENETTKDVTASATFSTPDMTTLGEKTVTVSYSEGDVNKETSYNISVLAPAVLTGITLSGKYPTTLYVGDAFSHEGMVVTASYDDETTKDVTDEATFTGYDMSAVGVQTVTVSYTDGEVTKTADYNITLSLKPGSEALPYTVAQAIEAIDNDGDVDGVYVKGIISQVDSYNSKYSSITYWISEDGTTANQLQVYSGIGLNGADFSSKEDVQVGDNVVVLGTLKKFNSTYEFDYNNQLVSLERANFITDAANATWVAPAKVQIKNDDVKVYTVTYDAAVRCTRKHEVADKVVPANGVVLLTSNSKGEATTVKIAATNDAATDYEALENANKNDLNGSDGTVWGDTNIFCLAVGEKGLGFYPVDSSIQVPAGKAYLLIPATQAAPSYIWFNGDTTAIDSLTTDTAAGNESGEIYSLTGQRVGKNYRGIVIMNGRKVLKK